MTAETVLFWVFAVCTVVSALGVIWAKSPVSSAMSLVATFFFLSGIYVLLLAHTIAVLQVLVYAGAVMVLFLFVIMLLSLTGQQSRGPLTPRTVLAFLSTGGVLFVLVRVLGKLPDAPPRATEGALGSFGTLHTVGNVLYTGWLFPFEAVSLLLLVAIVGAVVVAKAKI